MLVLATLLLLAAVGPATAAEDSRPGGDPVPDAAAAPPALVAVMDLLKQGDAVGALKGAREFLTSQPGSALGHEVHGIAAMANRLAPEAERAFHEALRLEPGRLGAMLRLGQLALARRDSRQAEGWFRKALAADPDLHAARRGLAVTLLRRWQLEAAQAELREVLRRSGGRDLEAKRLLAQIYHDAGRPAEAEPILDEVLATRPESMSALLLQGLVKLELGKADEAERLFEQVVERDPRSPGARLGLAMIERSRGALARAATAMESLARDNPDWPPAHFELGRTLVAQRELGAALRAFDRAEQVSPAPAVTRVRGAQVLFAAGEADRALLRARASLASPGAAPLARALITQIHVAKGMPEAAERELVKAVAVAPQDVTALLQLARFYLGQRRPADAARRFEEAAQARPSASEPLAGLVDAYLALGQADLALATGERLLRLQGETAGAYVAFAAISEKAGRPVEALAAYARALDREPSHLDAARARASLLERQQRVAEAIQLLEETARAHPQQALPLLDLGRMQERAGNPAAAAAAYRRALQRAPGSADLMNNLAYLLSADPASRDEALALAERAHALAPRSPAIADTLGWILYQKGDLGRAESLLAQAARAAPALPAALYHLGLIYARQGKTAEARRHLEEALRAPGFAEADAARKALEALE